MVRSGRFAVVIGITLAALAAVPSVACAQVAGNALQALMAEGMGAMQKGSGQKSQTISQATKKYKGGQWTLHHHIELPKTPFELRAGAVIPATLITGINSQNPGMVLAQVAKNVYDTASGNYLLIPQGARLVGEYATGVSYGQTRIMVVWKRITFPDGRVLDIGSMPGTDVAGKSGFEDEVNNHYLKTFGSAILLSTIAGAIGYAVDSNSVQTGAAGGTPVTVQGEIASQTGSVLGQQIGQIMNKSTDIAPTITIRPGYPFDVMVTKDMAFKAPYENVFTVP